MAARRRYKAFTFTPSSGGRLMASVSKDTIGIKNYITKRDFRRVLDREQRREGYDYFAPKDYLFTSQYSQDPASGLADEVNLVHMVRRPNGDKALIVGTTTGYLYRYEGTDTVRYTTDLRDSDHADLDSDGDKDYDDNYTAVAFGSELVSGNYSASGTPIKAITVSEGEEYLFNKGTTDISLTNGGETLTASGLFKAQSNSVTLTGYVNGAVISGSIKKHTATSDYAKTVSSEWNVIHTPDSTTKNRLRWEAVNINGFAVFNNGADLPLVYRVEWGAARPIYSLREAGVARVGTIAELNGILLCGDVSQMKAEDIQPQMETAYPYAYYSKSVDKVGYRVLFSDLDDPTSFGATAKGTIFESARVMAWKWLPSSMGKDEITITGAGVGGGNLTANIAGQYTKATAYIKANITSLKGKYVEGDYSKGIKHQDADEVEFEGISIIRSDINAATSALGLERAFEIGEIIHFKNGSAFQFTSNAAQGAITIYGNLIGNISHDEHGVAATNYIKLDARASTSIVNTEVAKSNAFSSTAGFDDLQDDGSRIIKMVKLQSVLVIYKENGIFVAEYTGNTLSPFRFNVIKVPSSKCLKYRHTVANVEGMAHIYAGASSFYSFDLASRKPKELPDFKNTDNVFFDNATSSNTESIYAADNQLTKEIWFVTNASTASDKALCYDYIFNTLSTTSTAVTAAATVKKPGAEQDWFIMGNSNGTVLTYGLSNETVTRWTGKNYFYHRGNASYSALGLTYDAILESGAEDFGDGFNEKDLKSYVLHLSHASDNPTIRVDISGYHNVGDVLSNSAAANVLDTRVFDDPDTKNLLPLYYKQHYFQDKIKITTGNTQVAGRTFEVAGVNSQSFVRTDDA